MTSISDSVEIFVYFNFTKSEKYVIMVVRWGYVTALTETLQLQTKKAPLGVKHTLQGPLLLRNYEMNTHTILAQTRSFILASSTNRATGRPDFTVNSRKSLTLVDSPDHFEYMVKVGGKTPLYRPAPNCDGTVTLTNSAGFSTLTIAGADMIALADKAGIGIDKALITHEDICDLPYEIYAELYHPEDVAPAFPAFVAPASEMEDLADLASAHLGTYYMQKNSPEPAPEPVVEKPTPNPSKRPSVNTPRHKPSEGRWGKLLGGRYQRPKRRSPRPVKHTPRRRPLTRKTYAHA